MSKIETLAEYQNLAKRTMTDLGSLDRNLIHMTTGYVTELGEVLDPLKKNLAYGKPLDYVNIGEEFADMTWYVVNWASLVGVKFDKANEKFKDIHANISASFKGILNEEVTATETEHIIKLIYNNLMLDPETFEGSSHKLLNQETFLVMLAVIKIFTEEIFHLDFYRVLTNNINKLKVRYPENFTYESALNRDLETERTELEK